MERLSAGMGGMEQLGHQDGAVAAGGGKGVTEEWEGKATGEETRGGQDAS